jgi:ABC-type sugar transport system permease subunit
MLPWTAPIALGTIGWLWMLDSIFSPIDWVFRSAGLLGTPGALLGPETNIYWLGRPGLAMASVIGVHVWRLLPLATVIQLAGLSSIPQDLIEAAEIDGAAGWRRTVEITIPLTLPIIGIAFLFGLIFTFNDMAVVYVLTRGGPVHSTQVLSTWTFFKGIEGIWPRGRRSPCSSSPCWPASQPSCSGSPDGRRWCDDRHPEAGRPGGAVRGDCHLRVPRGVPVLLDDHRDVQDGP